jgi:hypothetical protein
MDPGTMMMIGSAVQQKALNLGKTLFGGWQALRANRDIKKLRQNRPIYETPESATQALGLSRQMAYGEMPGRDYAEQRLGRATAAGVRQTGRMAGSSSAALGAVTDIYGRQLDAERELGYNAALYRAQMMQNYQGQLGQMANYEDQAFNINQWIPYQQRMNELQEQRMSGMQNMWGGMNQGAQTNANMMGTMYQSNALQGMMPQWGQGLQPQGNAGQPQQSPWMNAYMKNPGSAWSY